MRIAMIAIGSTGDVRPYVALGLELQKRGHIVCISAFPDFEKMVTSAGLGFHAIHGDAKLFMGNIMNGSLGLAYMHEVIAVMRPTLTDFMEDILSACRNSDAVIATYFGQVIRSAAEICYKPYIQTQYFPMDENSLMPIPVLSFGSAPPQVCVGSYRAAELTISAVEKFFLDDWRRQHGLPYRQLTTRDDHMINGHRIPVVYAVSPCVMPRPDDWDEHYYLTGFWNLPAGADVQPDEGLKRFVEAGSAPVVIGFGSMTGGEMQELMTLAAGAVNDAGVRGVLVTGWGAAVVQNSEKIYAAEFVPHSWILKRAAGFVHHGGAGTTAAGIRAGCPTQVIPFGGDQFFWGERVFRMGIGPRPISRKKLTRELLAESLRDLVGNPDYKRCAERAAAVMSTENGVCTAADVIEKELKEW